MPFTQRVLGAALAAAVLWLSAALPARAAPPPIEHFTKWPAIHDVVISPSGTRLAVIVYGPGGYHQVGVMDLDPIGQPRLVGGFADADVTDVQWISDDRLVFSAFPREAEVRDGGAGIFAVNHDGTASRLLIAWSMGPEGARPNKRVLPYGWFIHSTIDDGGDDVFVYRRTTDNRDELRTIELARLNTRTGALRSLSLGAPDGAREWLLDAKHAPRLLTTEREGRVKVYARGGDEASAWNEVADFDPLGEASFRPLWVDVDGSVLVNTLGGRDTSGLFRFHPATRKLDPDPVVSVTGFDLSTILETDSRTGRLVGLHVRTDRPLSVWFDPELQRIQNSIDAVLPAGRTNRLHCGRCESSRFFAIHSFSDRQPGEYFLFDRTKSSLQRIGAARPWIVEATQGRRTFHRVSTRDGLSMPVIVTHPADATSEDPLPAVVVVHGGPWVRGGDLGWQAEAQFLASRGYRVLEPEFRGSVGFGFRHFKAGWKQWGRAMQDDLVDAVRWAAKQRLVDASRVCVYGSRYGGYASLMAPVTHPGAFRCAASFAGVTDIDLMYSITWSDIPEAVKRHGMPTLIGDRDRDAEQLAAASPLKRAAEIKVPILLGHGAADRRVPMDHPRRFAAAARAAGAEIETVYYNREGHGWYDPQNHTDFLGRLERLLANALKQPSQ